MSDYYAQGTCSEYLILLFRFPIEIPAVEIRIERQLVKKKNITLASPWDNSDALFVGSMFDRITRNFRSVPPEGSHCSSFGA